MASGDDQYEDMDNPRVKTGQGQSQANPSTATVTSSSHDRTGQGQSQGSTESLDERNLSYGTGPTASQLNSLYKAVTQSQTITNTAMVMASGHGQTGQGQYQAIAESVDARNLSYGTGPTASQQNSVYTKGEIIESTFPHAGRLDN
ncbi:Bax inhibitor 1 [Branchiostoma belcheri]|nr:Bax inhibitor 1 [Branchiostoma belcheri]